MTFTCYSLITIQLDNSVTSTEHSSLPPIPAGPSAFPISVAVSLVLYREMFEFVFLAIFSCCWSSLAPSATVSALSGFIHLFAYQ